jgi:hypothetical protein
MKTLTTLLLLVVVAGSAYAREPNGPDWLVFVLGGGEAATATRPMYIAVSKKSVRRYSAASAEAMTCVWDKDGEIDGVPGCVATPGKMVFDCLGHYQIADSQEYGWMPADPAIEAFVCAAPRKAPPQYRQQ